MSSQKESFLWNVKVTLDLINPRAEFMPSKPEASELCEKHMKDAAFWLTPKAVENYREEDFEELDQSERKELTDLICLFRDVASSIPSNGPVTQENYDKGSEAFVGIFKIIKPILERFKGIGAS